MDPSCPDSIVDFDLSLLHETPKYDELQCRLTKQKKDVMVVKTKVMRAHAYLARYKQRKLSLQCAIHESSESKEECKQVRLEYKKALDNVTALEKDNNDLKEQVKQFYNEIQQAFQKFNQAENTVAALKSHIKQLESLVKVNESQIEAATLETKLFQSSMENDKKKIQKFVRSLTNIKGKYVSGQSLSQMCKLFSKCFENTTAFDEVSFDVEVTDDLTNLSQVTNDRSTIKIAEVEKQLETVQSHNNCLSLALDKEKQLITTFMHTLSNINSKYISSQKLSQVCKQFTKCFERGTALDKGNYEIEVPEQFANHSKITEDLSCTEITDIEKKLETLQSYNNHLSFRLDKQKQFVTKFMQTLSNINSKIISNQALSSISKQFIKEFDNNMSEDINCQNVDDLCKILIDSHLNIEDSSEVVINEGDQNNLLQTEKIIPLSFCNEQRRIVLTFIDTLCSSITAKNIPNDILSLKCLRFVKEVNMTDDDDEYRDLPDDCNTYCDSGNEAEPELFDTPLQDLSQAAPTWKSNHIDAVPTFTKDSGCGSSMASDSDSNSSPMSLEMMAFKGFPKLIDSATSPIKLFESNFTIKDQSTSTDDLVYKSKICYSDKAINTIAMVPLLPLQEGNKLKDVLSSPQLQVDNQSNDINRNTRQEEDMSPSLSTQKDSNLIDNSKDPDVDVILKHMTKMCYMEPSMPPSPTPCCEDTTMDSEVSSVNVVDSEISEIPIYKKVLNFIELIRRPTLEIEEAIKKEITNKVCSSNSSSVYINTCESIKTTSSTNSAVKVCSISPRTDCPNLASVATHESEVASTIIDRTEEDIRSCGKNIDDNYCNQSVSKKEQKGSTKKTNSKLEKLRKRLSPISKMKRPLNISRSKKIKQVLEINNTLQNSGESPQLNSKEAYQKALRIATELRSNEKEKKAKSGVSLKSMHLFYNIDENKNKVCSINRDLTIQSPTVIKSPVKCTNSTEYIEHTSVIDDAAPNVASANFLIMNSTQEDTNRCEKALDGNNRYQKSNASRNEKRSFNKKTNSKLQKFRKRLLPVSKIKRPTTPLSRNQSKKFKLLFKKINSEESLQCNNTNAYQKALKVAAELRAKQKETPVKFLKSQASLTPKETIHNKNNLSLMNTDSIIHSPAIIKSTVNCTTSPKKPPVLMVCLERIPINSMLPKAIRVEDGKIVEKNNNILISPKAVDQQTQSTRVINQLEGSTAQIHSYIKKSRLFSVDNIPTTNNEERRLRYKRLSLPSNDLESCRILRNRTFSIQKPCDNNNTHQETEQNSKRLLGSDESICESINKKSRRLSFSKNNMENGNNDYDINVSNGNHLSKSRQKQLSSSNDSEISWNKTCNAPIANSNDIYEQNKPETRSRQKLLSKQVEQNKYSKIVHVNCNDIIDPINGFHKSIIQDRCNNTIDTKNGNHRDVQDNCNNTIDTRNGNHRNIITYNDLNMLSGTDISSVKTTENYITNKVRIDTPKQSLNLAYFCQMLQKYGKTTCRTALKSKVEESAVDKVYEELEGEIRNISQLPADQVTSAMADFAQKLTATNYKIIVSSIVKYLMSPQRKDQVKSLKYSPPAPPMTPEEQILLYVIMKLRLFWAKQTDFTSDLLNYIEYTLFKINQTPNFAQVQDLSHFYAVLCRYKKLKNRLKVFIVNAMYCMAYKAVPLIQQCLDVWMHVLPLAHLSTAKNPLVILIVYLLHFYKCDDPLNRVQNLKDVLRRRYSYDMSEWNETKLLEYFRNSLYEIKNFALEKKLYRLCILVLAKRLGVKWTQKNIVNKLLLPIAMNKTIRPTVREFSISLLGPIMRPYPKDMKVNCEIVINHLISLFEDICTPTMEESIVTSLIYLNKICPLKVCHLLVGWKPKAPLSKEMEDLLIDCIRQQPLKLWLSYISKMSLFQVIL